MNIAIASGKGGTGKTTVATNLAQVMASCGETVTYVDCDVEEPNGHIFLKPHVDTSEKAVMLYPAVDNDRCISCGKCAEICQYQAIVMIAENPYVVPDMCHACGGCWLVCPVEALSPAERDIGIIETGTSDGIGFIHGKLSIGQVMSPPLIRQVKSRLENRKTVVIDCPPGTSCPVITAVQGSDYTLLVTEPTPFGLNDLKLAVGMIEKLGIPFGVFINRSDIGNNETVQYCTRNAITIIGHYPHDRAVAEAYSRGILASAVLPKVRTVFENLYHDLKREVAR